MSITSPDEMTGMRIAGAVVHRMLEAMKQEIRPGVTTAELDDVGARVMSHHVLGRPLRLFINSPE